MPAWSDYQEKAATFFRGIGMVAETNVTLLGVRTSHDVDVVVRGHHVGFDLLWLVECKHWQDRVTKLHVLALREIVSDLGADRGVLLAEAGFQKGAQEAATLTNVQLTSLAELEQESSYAIGMARLREIQRRADNGIERYWALGKAVRIAHGLRPHVLQSGYSAQLILGAVDTALNKAFRGGFPVEFGDISIIGVSFPGLPSGPFAAPNALADCLEGYLAEVETRLDRAERGTGSPDM